MRLADLCRIKGVGGNYAALLEAVGVVSVPDLAQRTAPSLWAAMERANSGEESLATAPALARALPSVHTVRRWVAQARRLPAVVES